jgi:hypothetical protein
VVWLRRSSLDRGRDARTTEVQVRTRLLLVGAVLFMASFCSCSPPVTSEEILFEDPINDLSGVLTRSGVELDTQITSDGSGSIKIIASSPTTVRLFEVGDIDIDDARLVYRARLRTEDVQGQVYLEMWCRFPGTGEFFSRALHSPISGSTGWISQETPFFLEKNQKPDLIKLNVVIDGSGTVWVDEVALSRSGS